jgi:hypothetical protein
MTRRTCSSSWGKDTGGVGAGALGWGFRRAAGGLTGVCGVVGKYGKENLFIFVAKTEAVWLGAGFTRLCVGFRGFRQVKHEVWAGVDVFVCGVQGCLAKRTCSYAGQRQKRFASGLQAGFDHTPIVQFSMPAV